MPDSNTMSEGATEAHLFAESGRTTDSDGSFSRRFWWQWDAWWVVPVSTLLGLVYWWPLVIGHGLLGGDLYPYFFPLKSWYADRLKTGELTLWNPLIGYGMPALAESQTASLYPPNLILYGLLSPNAAYNTSHIGHYVFAFAFACAYLRRLDMRIGPTLLGALVWVYGWFPARNCLEWAIVTGAWIPFLLWSVESYLARGRMRYVALVSVGLAMQLLAGHYHLAFITLLLLSFYVPLRVWAHERQANGSAHVPAEWRSRLVTVLVAILFGVGIAALQLVPSWELKNRSQRADESFRQHSLSYGNIPGWYLPQSLLPWMYYPDVHAGQLAKRFGDSNTNRIEAQLYFGMLPLGLAAAGLLANRRRVLAATWLLVGGLALTMVTSWWTESLGRLPGFGYFTGPGRYGIVVQLAVAVLAAIALDRLFDRIASFGFRVAVSLVLFLVVWGDLRWAASRVEFARPVPNPPVTLRDQSPVAAHLQRTDRVLSKNQNSITLTGAAMLPVYLGIGPAEYYQDPTRLPPRFRWDAPMSDDVWQWLRLAGVTHLLAFEPHMDWPCELVWYGYDPMLHTMLGRMPIEPLWLYRLNQSLGRAYWISDGTDDGPLAEPIADKQISVQSNRVDVTVSVASSGTLVLTDLAYPGWVASVDGEAVDGGVYRGMFRSVKLSPGEHVVSWRYRPMSFSIGVGVSGVSVLGWLMWFARRRSAK